MQDLLKSDLEKLPTAALYSLRFLVTSTAGHEAILCEQEFQTILKTLSTTNKQIYRKLLPFYLQSKEDYQDANIVKKT